MWKTWGQGQGQMECAIMKKRIRLIKCSLRISWLSNFMGLIVLTRIQ